MATTGGTRDGTEYDDVYYTGYVLMEVQCFWFTMA